MDSSANFSLGAGETCWTWFCNCTSVTCWWLGIFYFLFFFLSFYIFFIFYLLLFLLFYKESCMDCSRCCAPASVACVRRRTRRTGISRVSRMKKRRRRTNHSGECGAPLSSTLSAGSLCCMLPLHLLPFAPFFLLLPLTSSFTPVLIVFCRTGMIFGLMNNPRFSDGTPTSPFSLSSFLISISISAFYSVTFLTLVLNVSIGVDDMSTSVINVGGSAVDLGNGLLSNVTCISSFCFCFSSYITYPLPLSFSSPVFSFLFF